MLRPTYAFEGIDQVGKRTATNSTITRLVDMGYVVGKSDHPNYWITDTIRLMNRVHPGIMQVLKRAEDNGGLYRVAQLRAAHYALDRVFSLAMYAQQTDAHPDIIYVSNRLVLSNAVTAGYARFAGYLQAEEVPQFIQDTILPNEQDLLDSLDIVNFLCVNGKVDHAHNIERPLDVYELPGAQEMGQQVYDELFNMQAELNLDIRKLVTRTGNDWRNINDSVDEVIAHTQLPALDQPGQLIHIGPESFLETFAPKHLVARTHHGLWEKARALICAWNEMVLTADREQLDVFEMEKIAPVLKQLLLAVNPSDLDISIAASNTVARLFSIFPELVDLVRAGHGEFGDGMVQFLEALATQSQES